MKKLFSLLVVAAMLGLAACGPSEEEAQAKAEEMLEDLGLGDALDELEAVEEEEEEATEELAEHKCNEACTDDGCNFMCGEAGHECSDECAAKEEVEEEGAEG